MKRPLVWLAAAFCSGIVIVSRIKIDFWLIYSVALVFLCLDILTVRKQLIFEIILLLLAFLLGAASLKNSQILPKCHISRLVGYKNNRIYTIKGFIRSPPVLKNGRRSFILKTQELQFDKLKYNCSGDIIAHIKGNKDLHYGQEIILSGNLQRPFQPASYNRGNYRRYLYNQGVYYIMRVSSDNFVVRLNCNRGVFLKRFSFWLKEKIEAIIFRNLDAVPASILDAMVLGERKNIPANISNTMIKAGTVHILPRLYTKMPPGAL